MPRSRRCPTGIVFQTQSMRHEKPHHELKWEIPAKKKVVRIYDNIAKVIEIARRDGIPTSQAADRLAEERIERIGKLKKIGTKMPRKIARASDTLTKKLIDNSNLSARRP